MCEVHVRLRGVRTGKPVAADLHPIKHTAIVRNQHDEILTRVDGLRLDGRLELLLDVRIEVEPGARLPHRRRLELGGRERRICKTALILRIQRAEPVLESAPLKKREVRTTAVTVDSIGCAPRLQQPFVVPNAEAAIREVLQKRLVAQVLDDLVHESEAWRRNSRGEVREVGNHIPLRPALSRVLRSQQGAHDARGLGRAQICPRARPNRYAFFAGTLDQKHAGDLQAAVASQVVPTPAVGLAERRHPRGHARHGEYLGADYALTSRAGSADQAFELTRLEIQALAFDAENRLPAARDRNGCSQVPPEVSLLGGLDAPAFEPGNAPQELTEDSSEVALQRCMTATFVHI